MKRLLPAPLSALLLALIATLLVYWPTLHASFLFDDAPNLGALNSIDHVASLRDLGIYLSQPRSFPGRPIAMLSFLLQKSSWPNDPFSFHLVNLGIHLLNGLLVYLLLARIIRFRLGGDAWKKPQVWVPAVLGAAIWLINPIQLSGVTLVVQRMTLLAATFVLLGLHAYLNGLLNEQGTARRRGLWMLLGLGLCMGLAFLSKENGILLPVYVLVLDATILRGPVSRITGSLAWWRRLLVWPVTAFVAGYLAWMTVHQWGYSGIRDFTVGERLLTEPRILFDYLGKFFLPRFGLYGLYHDGYTVSRSLFSPWTTLPALACLLALAAAAFTGRRRWPLLALAVLWYLGGQMIESSSIMLELYFEHRNYIPLIGIVLALSVFVAEMTPGSRRRLAYLLAAIWILACGLTTTLSAHIYANEDRLAVAWSHQQPNSIRAQTFLASRLYLHGQAGQALQVIDTIAAKHPHDSALAENRVYLKCMQESLTPSDVEQLDRILATAVFDRGGFENMETLRKLAFSSKCPALNPQTWLRLTDTLLANPVYGKNSIASGYLHYQRHFWAVSEGRLDMAIHELDETYTRDPDAEIPRLKAKYLVSAGLYKQAVHALRDVNYAHLPRLRRWLVNDRAINAEDIARIQAMEKQARLHGASPAASSTAPIRADGN